MPPVSGAPLDLGGGLWQFQTALWQTNTLLARAGGEVLLCDPNYRPEEIEAIRAEALREDPAAVHLLLTHGDFDHTCGVPYFPEAAVVAGPETAEAIGSGAAAQGLRGAAVEWGLDWPGELRVDRVVVPGEDVALGCFRLETIDARGHVADGLAYVLLDQGVLLPGDYLSSMTYPFVIHSVEGARRTYERLLEALDRHELRWVVPGHGDALEPVRARAVAEEDVRYLEQLLAAAREARGSAPGDALLAVFSGAPPPRPTTDDFEMYGIHALNVQRALAEAG
jgi:hydroxyacylglutathione hydrolase